jgi:hypothetical protein
VVDTGCSHAQDMAPVPAMEMPVLDFAAQSLPGSPLPCGHHGADPRGEMKSYAGDHIKPWDGEGLVHKEEHGETVV